MIAYIILNQAWEFVCGESDLDRRKTKMADYIISETKNMICI